MRCTPSIIHPQSLAPIFNFGVHFIWHMYYNNVDSCVFLRHYGFTTDDRPVYNEEPVKYIDIDCQIRCELWTVTVELIDIFLLQFRQLFLICTIIGILYPAAIDKTLAAGGWWPGGLGRPVSGDHSCPREGRVTDTSTSTSNSRAQEGGGGWQQLPWPGPGPGSRMEEWVPVVMRSAWAAPCTQASSCECRELRPPLEAVPMS